MTILKNIYNKIEPSFRGFAFMLLGLLVYVNYDNWTSPDIDNSLFAKSRLMLILFHKIDLLGGKFLLIGMFVFVGLMIVFNDLKKQKKQ